MKRSKISHSQRHDSIVSLRVIKTMAGPQELEIVARKLFWWQPPEVSLANTPRFLAQVMTFGTWAEVKQVEKSFGVDAFRDALAKAPAGVFDLRSWSYWHAVFGLPEADLPRRSLK